MFLESKKYVGPKFNDAWRFHNSEEKERKQNTTHSCIFYPTLYTCIEAGRERRGIYTENDRALQKMRKRSLYKRTRSSANELLLFGDNSFKLFKYYTVRRRYIQGNVGGKRLALVKMNACQTGGENVRRD